jgi:hypothetical protein
MEGKEMVSLKINVDQVLKELDGSSMLSYKVADGQVVPDGELTFGGAAITFLNRDSDKLEPKEKLQRYKLCLRLLDGGEQVFTPEEISLVREVTGKYASIVLYGRMCELTEDQA